MSNITKTQTTEEKLAEEMTISAGGSKTREVSMNDFRGRASLSYNITTTLGSPSVEVQVFLGTDAGGAEVWHTVDSSTGASDLFYIDGPVRRARVKISEVDGVDGLDGIAIWSVSRPL